MKLKKLAVVEMRPDANQPRRDFDEAEIRALAESLKADGQFIPVIVYPVDEFQVIADGERRWRAAPLAGVTELEAIVLDRPPTPVELLKLQVKVNCLRQELNPLERALAYQRLLETEQCTQSALAEMLHLSNGTVSNYFSLLKAPPEIQALVTSSKLPVSSVATIMRAKDRQTQLELAEQAVAGTLSRDTLQGRVRRKKIDQEKVNRIQFKVDDWTVTIAGPKRIGFETAHSVLDTGARESRRGIAQQLDLLTWTRVMNDRARAGSKKRQDGLKKNGDT
jgi:ParB family chromosome partitioning protein